VSLLESAHAEECGSRHNCAACAEPEDGRTWQAVARKRAPSHCTSDGIEAMVVADQHSGSDQSEIGVVFECLTGLPEGAWSPPGVIVTKRNQIRRGMDHAYRPSDWPLISAERYHNHRRELGRYRAHGVVHRPLSMTKMRGRSGSDFSLPRVTASSARRLRVAMTTVTFGVAVMYPDGGFDRTLEHSVAWVPLIYRHSIAMPSRI
jgi:hypothetical protein